MYVCVCEREIERARERASGTEKECQYLHAADAKVKEIMKIIDISVEIYGDLISIGKLPDLY